MQINRLFEIVYILLDKKAITAEELARHFGVSRRTICRDVDILSTAGIPIYTERGRGGGIRLLPDFVLNKSILSEQEQEEILNALLGLSNVMTDETNQVLSKLSTLFGKRTSNWLEVDFTGWSYENDFFNKLKSAILHNRIVQFDYYNRYGDRTSRRVEPMQLWFKSRSWYLKGFCLSKQDMRLYKLPCIKNLVVTEDFFEPRHTIDLTGNPIKSLFENQELSTIKLHIAQERAYRVFEDFHEHMIEKQPDGNFIVTVCWPEDNWLTGFILSYGRYITVLEPQHLRSAIQEEADMLYSNHL